MKLQKLLLVTVSATAFMVCIGCSSNKTSYFVTFETNGGTEIEKQKVNGTLTRPEDPIKRPYVFGGWYSDSALTTEFDFSKPITADTTLYAKWNESVQFTYVYHAEKDGDRADSIEFNLDYLHFDEISTEYFDLVIDWGDGTSDIKKATDADPGELIHREWNINHSYGPDKTEYNITIHGLVNGIQFSSSEVVGNTFIKSINVNQLIYSNVVCGLRLGYNSEHISEVSQITLPNNLIEISSEAMAYTSITSFTISESVVIIHNDAFHMTPIESIDFSNAETLYIIGSSAFNSCSKLKEVTFPENLCVIKDDAFRNCEALKEVTFTSYFPPHVAENAFDINENNGLSKIYVPKGRRMDYAYAWANNPNLVALIEEIK